MPPCLARITVLLVSLLVAGPSRAAPFVADGLVLAPFADGRDLSFIDGLAFDGDGNLWGAIELTAREVVRFDSDGNWAPIATATLNRPDQIEYDSERDVLYVSEEFDESSRIIRITPAGVVSELVPAGVINNPEGMAFDPVSGDLFVEEDLVNGRIFRVDLDTEEVSIFLDTDAGLQRVEGLVFNTSGDTLYATETLTNRILAIDRSGKISVLVDASAGILMPDNILLDPTTGLLYVSEDQTPSMQRPELGRVWQIDPEAADPGASATVVAGSFAAPQGMVQAADGTLYVSEQLGYLSESGASVWTLQGLPVPEPAGRLMQVIAIAAILFVGLERRRRRNAPA